MKRAAEQKVDAVALAAKAKAAVAATEAAPPKQRPAKKVGRKVTAKSTPKSKAKPAAKKGKAAPKAKATPAAKKTTAKKPVARDRATSLTIQARSLRGVNRNLRLEGVGAQLQATEKGLQAFKGSWSGREFKASVKTGKEVKHDGQQVKAARALTYGQWVTAVRKAIGGK